MSVLERKISTKWMKIMLIFLIILLVLSFGFYIYIYSFNNTPRQYSSGEKNKNFSLTITPRTGQTDSWPKLIEENGVEAEYKGTIYEGTLTNTGSYNIAQWSLRINITQDLYLNNAWCGTFEIHQHVNGEELVQTVDLRNYQEKDLIIQHKIAGPDLLIPLHAGDYMIYYPDATALEYPVYHDSGDEGTISKVAFGIIIYDQNEGLIEMQNYQVDYYLQRVYRESLFFYVLCFGAIIWLLCLLVMLIVERNLRKARQRFMQDEHIIHQSIGVFTRFFEAKDSYTNGHSQRVADYSRLLAQKLGFSEEELRQIYYIGLMHDCGKCYIPDAILKKPDKLTAEEYKIIKKHPQKGAEMLEDFSSVENIRDGVLYHHERYDGTGYPKGLKGEEIPLVARIICVADCFDTMNSKRHYRDKLDKDYILSELEENKGKQFDPALADLFLELIREGKIKIEESDTTC